MSNLFPRNQKNPMFDPFHKKLITDLQFGFMAGKSSVDQLCSLMDDQESKKGTAMFLLSVDLNWAYRRVDNLLMYKKLKEKGLQKNGDPISFTYSLVDISKWSLTQVFRPPGLVHWLPSTPIWFNLYIEPTLKELNRHAWYLYADDNTLSIQSRPKESRSELFHGTASLVNIVDGRYR